MEDAFKEQVLRPVSLLEDKLSNYRMDYFFKVWKDFWSLKLPSDKPIVAITDGRVPDIYIRASGASPLYLLGGSYFSDKYTEEVFPQISDPVVKSVCSMLFSGQLSKTDLAAIVMPINSVSARKALPYLRDAGFTVIPVEEETHLSTHAPRQFASAQMEFLLELQKVTQCQVTPQKLYVAAGRITKAHQALQKLDAANLPTLAKSFIHQTYFMATDVEEWSHEVELLSDQSELLPKKTADLLLTGSPIYFPNCKIPLILQGLGITEYENRCGVPGSINYEEIQNSGKKGRPLFESLHELHYQSTLNENTNAVHTRQKSYKNYAGVIYHLLKGQLPFAYEAEKTEKICIREGVPFVIVETDYTDADTEQIRIRLEAFSELLRQTR